MHRDLAEEESHPTAPAAHRRSERARRAILQAADNLLVERGFDGVTVEGIAARAGVGKQTIYRWWPSKTDILLEALLEDAEVGFEFPDTGDPIADVRQFLRNAGHFLTATDSGRVYRALLGRALHDTEAAETLRTGYQDRQRERNYPGIERLLRHLGVRDRSQQAIETIHDALLGPVIFVGIIRAVPVEDAFVNTIVDTVVAGLRATAGE
jgi:AcrR family transcriptional regulator